VAASKIWKGRRLNNPLPRGIAVVDIGYTNLKVMLFGPDLRLLAERRTPSPHRVGNLYREIDVEPMLAFFTEALRDLDQKVPIDTIITCGHGAAIAALDAKGRPAVPIMDYMSEPPPDVLRVYTERCPSYAETYSPQLPVALLHAMQLFWQQQALPDEFALVKTILPLPQYVSARLGGRHVTEISSMACQSHLLNLNTLQPSELAIEMGWAEKFAPAAKAWDVIGSLKQEDRGPQFRGQGNILAGVHDSNANYLRYLAGGVDHFTLLSTGTWIIGFEGSAEIKSLNPARDIVANVDVFGRVVPCCRFFGGKELEIISGGASGAEATLLCAAKLVGAGVMALPSFSDTGGPMPGTGKQGRITATLSTSEERASLASLYCALMVSESLDAITSTGSIIVDGPFSENKVFVQALAALRPTQKLLVSNLRDGTAAGAACLALMPDGLLPKIDIDVSHIQAADFNMTAYQNAWRVQI
jgi:sugar (pentulose or hexulose) kinase